MTCATVGASASSAVAERDRAEAQEDQISPVGRSTERERKGGERLPTEASNDGLVSPSSFRRP